MKKNLFFISAILLMSVFVNAQVNNYKVVFDMSSKDTINQTGNSPGNRTDNGCLSGCKTGSSHLWTGFGSCCKRPFTSAGSSGKINCRQ